MSGVEVKYSHDLRACFTKKYIPHNVNQVKLKKKSDQLNLLRLGNFDDVYCVFDFNSYNGKIPVLSAGGNVFLTRLPAQTVRAYFSGRLGSFPHITIAFGGPIKYQANIT